MSSRKFKFVSPGIFINEIDESGIPREAGDVGPIVIGRSRRGPSMHPVRINSFADFIQVFGPPVAGGNSSTRDVWRDGNLNAPMYATYAAQAWLRNNTPLTFVRLTGRANSNTSTTSTPGTEGEMGYAGWNTEKTALSETQTSNGGAFGLWIVETGSAVFMGNPLGDGTAIDQNNNATAPDTGSSGIGTLAAVWYLNSGSIQLSGNDMGSVATASAGAYIQSVDTGPAFKVVIRSGEGDGNITTDTSFDFSPTSPRYIRKVFNTDPTLTNTSISNNTTNYWLGETFEGNLKTFKDNDSSTDDAQGGISGTLANSSQCVGIILPLCTPDGSTTSGGDYRFSSTKDLKAKTGWYISQDVTSNSGTYSPANMQKLFRFVARDESGIEVQNTVKISITTIDYAKNTFNDYGSFSVVIRAIHDTDEVPIIYEQYNNVNLNPYSNNYIAKVIGDSSRVWSDVDRRYRELGNYQNVSNYVRVEMNTDVDAAAVNPEYLPFGVYGPPRFGPWANSGTVLVHYNSVTEGNASATGTFVGDVDEYAGKAADTFITGSKTAGNGGLVCGAFKFPTLRLRISSSEGTTFDPQEVYFGVDTTYKSSRFDKSVLDVLRAKPSSINSHVADSSEPLSLGSGDLTEPSFIFSLDDVRNENVMKRLSVVDYSSNAVYQSGSRTSGLSYTAHSASAMSGKAGAVGSVTASYRGVLDAGWDQFTTCLHGGTDALNIRERDPFNNTRALSTDLTELTSYAVNSVKVALDSISDPEVVEYNLACMPGITNNNLNQQLVDVCSRRGDALAILDLKGGYQPPSENKNPLINNLGDVSGTVNNLRNTLKLNTSYGCAYYPWVQIRDTLGGAVLWAPPSVVALGAMAYSERVSQLWFAPAGFTRGGLSINNAAGVPVLNVREKLTSKQRDQLYDANINPIASFPAEGVVIFGQKTLQVTQSALDRINVRRLLIYLKKQVSRMAATVLFDQNVRSTWNRFRGTVEPFLDNVKSGLGIIQYRLVLDESTTTPDLIDRNIMYAKIFIKPARAIEFIAIDFVITDSGAAFAD